MKHKNKCQCKGCQLKEKGYSDEMVLYLRNKEDEANIKKHGFVAHYVFPIDGSKWANYHTHGLTKTKNHLDLQVVLPINPEIVHSIIWAFVRKITEKRTFKDGDLVNEIIENYPVKLKKTIEDGRQILRVLLPDENGLFNGDKGCDPLYAEQETVII